MTNLSKFKDLVSGVARILCLQNLHSFAQVRPNILGTFPHHHALNLYRHRCEFRKRASLSVPQLPHLKIENTNDTYLMEMVMRTATILKEKRGAKDGCQLANKNPFIFFP
jgi:hypothetical protein